MWAPRLPRRRVVGAAWGSGARHPPTRAEDDKSDTAEITAVKHAVKTDISWLGSGRDDDPWVMGSWDVEWCGCEQPWRHGWLA